MPDITHKSLYALQMSKERYLNIQKYFYEMQKQLQNNLEITINKLQIKKEEIIARIEFKFQAYINEIKNKEKDNMYSLSKDMKGIINNLKQNEEMIKKILKGQEVDDNEINKILNYKINIPNIEGTLLDISIDDLDLFTFADDKIKNNLLFNNNNRSTASSPFRPSTPEKFKLIISTLHVKESNNCDNYEKEKIQLYVPYGTPAYSCFYLIKVPQNYTAQSLIQAIKKKLQENENYSILIKNSINDKQRKLDINETIPQYSHQGWPKLYLKINSLS